MNKAKQIGTTAESAVVRVLQINGFPQAERRALKGTYDEGDVTGTPGIVWEVKGGNSAKTASDGLIAAWMNETEKERVNANADIGILVVQRSGIGVPNAGRWWAIVSSTLFGHAMPYSDVIVRLHLQDVCKILVQMGYGSSIDSGSLRA